MNENIEIIVIPEPINCFLIEINAIEKQLRRDIGLFSHLIIKITTNR